ncbi:hypothetical protein Q3G72_028646 [Acer saccharum]|nr:hypothetical protein Q3G72_028646 [Acer saccharum]
MPESIPTSPPHRSTTDFFSDPVHLSSLNHELIHLIDRDYADFVNLSTKLVDVDTVVVRMRAPLLELRENIEGFRGSVEGSLVASQSALKQRSEAAAAREVLQLLLDTSHVVSKVEKLIKELPRLPTHWSNRDVNLAERNSASYAATLQNVENGTNLRETQSMLLERIASEMNRLKFYIAHAQNLPFIGNMEKRFQSASLLLDASLGHCFVDGLEHQDANVIYCKFLLEISSTENSGLHVFDFLANSILKEVLSAIQKGKPGAFSPGRPSEFLKNYKSSLDFLAHLEGYCPSRSAVAKFRAKSVYFEFMKQWNVRVYFSLRFQEIAGALHSALIAASLAPIHNSHSDEGKSPLLTLKLSATLLESLRTCWREDVFILTCSDKFFRLSLQLLSRYSNWLSSGLAARKVGNSGANPGNEWAISASLDDFIYILHDTNCLASEVCGDYLAYVLNLLSSCPAEVLDLVKQSIIQGGMALNALQPSVINTIVEKAVEDLTATFRVPRESLPAATFRQLKALLEGKQAMMYLTTETKNKLLVSAANEIIDRYYKKFEMAKETESSPQKQGTASMNVTDHNVSENDNFSMQLFLDIQEYGRILAALGVEATDIPAYCYLWRCVTPLDRQSVNKFLRVILAAGSM